MKAFVVSDIHGMYDEFTEILKHWNSEDKLVILGDMVDRGKYSYEVVHKVMKLKEEFPDKVVYLIGNHEDMLLNYLKEPYEHGNLYYLNGGGETVYSFTQDNEMYFKCYKTRADTLINKHPEEVEFLKSGLLNYEFGKVLFTHAGFKSFYREWERSKDTDFIWIRDHYKHKNETGLINVFGHTPTLYMHKSHDVWVSKCGTYIGIDGACAYGGQLNAILIDDEGVIHNTYKVVR